MSRKKKTHKELKQFLNIGNEVQMSAPWSEVPNSGRALPQAMRATRGNICLQKGENLTEFQLKDFVAERSAVHSEYIRQTEATKRWAMGVSCTTVIAACASLLFAPEGREAISYGVSFALVAVAAGAFGFSRVQIKSQDRTLKVEQK